MRVFLNVDLKEGIYMWQSEGYVCKIKRRLYVLKQTPHEWNLKNSFISKEHSSYRISVICVHLKRKWQILILAIYVADLSLAGSDLPEQ